MPVEIVSATQELSESAKRLLERRIKLQTEMMAMIVNFVDQGHKDPVTEGSNSPTSQVMDELGELIGGVLWAGSVVTKFGDTEPFKTRTHLVDFVYARMRDVSDAAMIARDNGSGVIEKAISGLTVHAETFH